MLSLSAPPARVTGRAATLGQPDLGATPGELDVEGHLHPGLIENTKVACRFAFTIIILIIVQNNSARNLENEFLVSEKNAAFCGALLHRVLNPNFQAVSLKPKLSPMRQMTQSGAC